MLLRQDTKHKDDRDSKRREHEEETLDEAKRLIVSVTESNVGRW
jgi:hypothetical protein